MKGAWIQRLDFIKTSKTNELVELRFAIVKHIIDVRLAEKDTRANATLKESRKKELLALLARKKQEDDLGKSTKEIEKMIAELSV